MNKQISIPVTAIKKAIGGDISTSNSKMPGASFGLSVTGCSVGGALRDVEGSVCQKCYAARLEAMRPSVRQGWTARLEAVRACSGNPEATRAWVDAMVQRIATKCAKAGPFFRWHDSGDLQGLEHLKMIVDVAIRLPAISFWLPTKEKAVVRAYLRNYKLPSNLVVRVSAAMVDGKPVNVPGALTSTVTKAGPAVGHECPARHQGNACGDCRACWNPEVPNVAYPLH